MKTGTRLTVGFSFAVLAMLLTVVFCLNTSRKMHEEFELLKEDIIPGAIAMADMAQRTEEIHRYITEYIATGEYGKEGLQSIIRLLEKSGAQHLEHEEHIGLEEKKAAEQLVSRIKEVNSAAMEIVMLKDQGKSIEELRRKEDEEFHPAIIALHKQLNEHKATHLEELAASQEAVHNAHASGRQIALLASGVIALLAAGIAFATTRSIVKPLKALHKGAEIIGSGDLGYRVATEAKDEIGQLSRAFDKMTNEIQKRNEELQTMNEELQSTNEELESSNEELRSTTEELETANEELSTTTTELQGANKEIKELNENLEKKVEERTEELMVTNEELRSTTEELEASNEELRTTNEELEKTQEKLIQQEKLAAVGQLASGVGHELRNPLGVIKNAAYYIRTKVGTDDPKLAKHLNIMEREINNSNKIISDLLGFSRTRPPSIVPSDINKVVEQALEAVEIPEGVLLAKDLGSELPKIMADPDQIRQVFVNLSLNAIQAMAEGGQLKIVTRSHGDFIEAEFSDTGCGVPTENLDKLFDPFFTTKARGVGLGLAVSHGIMERNNGTIEVKSEVRKGTTFLVRLPCEERARGVPKTDKQEIAVS